MMCHGANNGVINSGMSVIFNIKNALKMYSWGTRTMNIDKNYGRIYLNIHVEYAI